MTITLQERTDKYEIVIRKTITRVVETRKRVVIDERPYTDEEIEEANHWTREDWKTELKKIHGWSAPIEDEDEITFEVYRQTVSDLDLPSVIAAINEM